MMFDRGLKRRCKEVVICGVESEEEEEEGGRLKMMSNQVVEVKRDAIAAVMTCPLCHKLLREATTISECLHTFCKKCIYTKLSDEEESGCCPTCQIDLGCLPLKKLRTDYNLQDVRAKVFPYKRLKVNAHEISPSATYLIETNQFAQIPLEPSNKGSRSENVEVEVLYEDGYGMLKLEKRSEEEAWDEANDVNEQSVLLVQPSSPSTPVSDQYLWGNHLDDGQFVDELLDVHRAVLIRLKEVVNSSNVTLNQVEHQKQDLKRCKKEIQALNDSVAELKREKLEMTQAARKAAEEVKKLTDELTTAKSQTESQVKVRVDQIIADRCDAAVSAYLNSPAFQANIEHLMATVLGHGFGMGVKESGALGADADLEKLPHASWLKVDSASEFKKRFAELKQRINLAEKYGAKRAAQPSVAGCTP